MREWLCEWALFYMWVYVCCMIECGIEGGGHNMVLSHKKTISCQAVSQTDTWTLSANIPLTTSFFSTNHLVGFVVEYNVYLDEDDSFDVFFY